MSKSISNHKHLENKLSQRDSIYLGYFAWGLSLIVSVLAVFAWGHSYQWHFSPFSLYQLFPVLGLLAFSIMWSHYIASAARQLLHIQKEALLRYFNYTSLAVLALICLHPGLLIYQRYRDGFGFPPKSYESYVAPGLGWVTVLGSACFLIFIAYELRRVYGQRSWWKYMQYASDAAMLGIFYHSIRLGDQLQMGWFRTVWWFYGVTLVLVLIYNYSKKYAGRPTSV